MGGARPATRGGAFRVSETVLPRPGLLPRLTWLADFRTETLVFSRGVILVRIPRTFPIEASLDGRQHSSVFKSGGDF